jgi:uncharacterized iron-regulated protein
MDVSRAGFIVCLFLAGSCGPKQDPHYGTSRFDPQSPPPEQAAPSEAGDETMALHVPREGKRQGEVPEDVVARAALPIHGFRLSDRRALPPDELWSQLARAQAVCIGEEHGNPHHHYGEFAVVSELARRTSMTGREIGIGLEMFERQFQDPIDRHLSGKSNEAELLEESEYAQRWGFAFAFYRPLFDVARERGLPVIALNAESELVDQVAEQGLSVLDEQQRDKLGGIDESDKKHRAQFDRLMKHHPPEAGDADKLYAAQLLWDETMAANAAAWLAARQPARLLVVVAGSAHCHASAIPKRLKRRLKGQVVSIRPVVAHGKTPGEVEGYDYALMMSVD